MIKDATPTLRSWVNSMFLKSHHVNTTKYVLIKRAPEKSVAFKV